jgi:oxygen-independent coproporphyrinogen-3 oxidase
MKPLAIYVHIPFCTVKCGYCDFNAYAGMDVLKPRYNEAILAEIDSYASLLSDRQLTSIHFGGGTPGEVPPAHISAVIERLSRYAQAAPDAEIGLETNPGTTSYDDLALLRAAGVNRLSLGAQSFHSDELRFLERIHSPEATAATVRNARLAGFPSLSLDLIYGLPGQTMTRWESSLGAAIALEPDHISCYGLTVEDGTLLGRRVAEGTVVPLDPDLAADMYERATDMLAAAGFSQYELSNWARPGHESRHNQVYWRDGDYLGLGAGAHGYVDGQRYENIAHPRTYVASLLKPGATAVTHAYRPDRVTAISDWLALRLRLVEGLDPADFAATFGLALTEVVGPPIRECSAAGLLEEVGGRIRLSSRGRLLHSEVAVRLLLHFQSSPVTV